MILLYIPYERKVMSVNETIKGRFTFGGTSLINDITRSNYYIISNNVITNCSRHYLWWSNG